MAKDLGDILLRKGIITSDELQQAREEEKQKSAVQESRTDAILAKLPKWLDHISLFGDARTRYEGFYVDGVNARSRFRIRARIGLTSKISDEISGTVRLATGNADDPISTNQTFERTFTRKPVNLDQAYLTLSPGETFNMEPGMIVVTAGKFGVNAYRASELLWDDDLSPEGATETVNAYSTRDGFLRGLKLNAFQWVIDEISAARDPWMFGGQVVADTAFGSVANLTLAFADFHYEDLDSVAKKFLPGGTSPNGQLTTSNRAARDASGKVTGYLSRYNIVNGGSELNFSNPIGLGVPGGVFGEVAYNTQADGRNVGFYVGAGIGSAGKDYYHDGLKNKGDWGVSYTYAWVEQDAVLSLFSYSDIDYMEASGSQKGSTNVSAHIVRADYELLQNLQLTAKTEFINALDRLAAMDSFSPATLSGNPTLVRLQVDAVLKF